MRILSHKPSHDGAIACVEDASLRYSIEGEKDSNPRHSEFSLERALELWETTGRPDVLASSGWDQLHGGYWGIRSKGIVSRDADLLGMPVTRFASSHERSHLLCAYGMSPFPQGQPCYALVWEGIFGNFYFVDDEVRFTRLGSPLLGPGYLFAFVYFLLKKTVYRNFGGDLRDAGKLMALAAFGAGDEPCAKIRTELERLFALPVVGDARSGHNLVIDKDAAGFEFSDIGFEHPTAALLAFHFQNELFARFETFARGVVSAKLPLLISGGCGLNCQWNSWWEATGLFEDVFVPPCCNDSGSAIGTAIDAQLLLTGNAKIRWEVYAGEEFLWNRDWPPASFEERPFDVESIARHLLHGRILAWVQGRYEIGPRALGARSILAEPFSTVTRDRLNQLKHREAYRPIAPVTTEAAALKNFGSSRPTPHMLNVRQVTNAELAGVTHVDGSARLQTVSRDQAPRLFDLLEVFGRLRRAPVLANTSLNFPGRGFINRSSSLSEFVEGRDIDLVVVNERLFIREQLPCREGDR
ncbi:MAG: carbamoyltransferase C-terminal domain-containing protein [Terrimicrobiaceae bacterium]